MSLPTPEQSKILSTLEDLAKMLQKAQINIKKCPKQRLTEGYIKSRLKSIGDDWIAFKQAHSNLTRCTPREQRTDFPYFHNEEYFEIEELYINIRADLMDILAGIEGQRRSVEAVNFSTSTQDSQQPFAKLPRIQLPTFSGKYEDWPTYQDLFEALVHNTSLSDVQKLHYLKTSVSGEAEMLLRNIQITGRNYTQAWNILKERFGNKRIIVNSILKRLFAQKKVISQSASQMKTLLDTTAECITSLNNFKIKTDSWDPVIVFLVGQKLDTESLKEWEQQVHKDNFDELPTWAEMKKFLELKFRTLELVAPITSNSTRERSTNQKSFHIASEDNEIDEIQSAHSSINSKQTCSYCNEVGHYIYSCKEFVKQPVDKRHEFAKKRNLCFNCLIPNHSVYKCRQKTSCRVCQRRHHSLLHQTKNTNQEESSQPEQNITTAHFSNEQPGHKVLLATAQVEVSGNDGNTHLLRALIDQGSEASFVSARVVELLGLKRTNINGVVSGVGENTNVPIKHLVDLSVKSQYNDKEIIQVKAYVLKKISTCLPSRNIVADWKELQTLQLADPAYHTPGKIDLLLGADIFCKIIEEGLVRMPDGIVAQKTSLGWILSGQKDKGNNSHNLISLHVTSMVAEDNDLLRKFWEIETDLYKKKKLLTKEEERCEDIYKQTTRRENTGRYIVHLPLKQSIEETVRLCGDTKQQAINRFRSLERKFENNKQFKEDYKKVIQEYKEMGHMKKSNKKDDKHAIYLPHHAIVREDKETSKVRVVYDASAKGTNNHSLNDTMMVGPVLQPDLRSLIISWRTHKICVVGDIEKMYRMINMTDEHTSLQRIIWRNEPEKELECYDLTTVTFGTAAAPYLAVRTLNQLAEDEAQTFPDTAPVIKNSFYMDDLMTGNDNIEATIKMCEEIRTILKGGGFNMQKWSSNSEEVLKYLQEGESSTKDKIEIKLDKIIKILGLTWDRKDDTFKFTVNLPEMRYPITKRSILSDVARLFDPFGWLSPVVVTAKVLIQKLWLCSLGWDDELPLELREEWIAYRQELIHLQSIEIPRWLKTTTKNRKQIQLHGFADASTQAYAAVTYLRVVEDDEVHVMMIASRTKVAPLKQISVPKLELCAAALLAELIEDLMEILKIDKDQIFVWTDSMVVLAWLQSQPSRWRTFVANRVADVIRILDNSQWRHVQSADNPADFATRGVKACDLAALESWWTGPRWLKEETLELQRYSIPQTDLEAKHSFHNTITEEPIWERFSTMSRMKRVLAYCRRILKEKETIKREKHLTTNEMERVEEECIKYYQNLVYGKEIEALKKEGRVKKRSSLITLAPFLDEKGLIRVGGRLHNASMAENTKHPIIIPNNQHITKLLIHEAHIKTLHGGIQLMMTFLRSKYWVIGLKSAVRKCIRTCKTCIVDKAKGKNQFMGQLPAVRVNPHRAFSNSGVDYAGPVLIRTSKGRGHHATKGYICLFVCMATRAIHLEAVTDLTTQAFMAAFRRFVARRGQCLHLWSDNGTNFVGAAKELKELFQKGKDNLAAEVAELLANDGTTWHFIPPKMPTCGGLWEAGVQSAKRHLIRVNKDTKLTFEEMTTLLTQIEACLNSRPLCQIDNTSETPLTPGHFLVGEPLISVPDLNYEHKNICLLSRWQMVQKMTQEFWRRWKTEYLNTLQQRYKWQVAISTPKVGDMVVIKDEDTPPTKWLLGRIKKVHPGADNLVRVVTVQCKGNHELKRPISKLIPLPVESLN
ncbi:uncharacterized protein LOC135076893 [Ostrinia nubilalis]|uniref:uncharacterized protein LOC135076893 n=1 Tax=Ostrinia nubilalis TaxID=29057 RepID=UPI00308233D6